MSRIPWSTYDGEDIERVIAVMLCSENPAVGVVRPGRGDGGLDVIVPSGDDAHDVYQIKKFAQNLTANQKKQIEKSFKRVLRTAEAGHIKISNWYLTMPLDPTPGNRAWFKKLTAEASFDCEWRGLVFCERLVTDHENVVDYYLRDGKDRLAEAMADALTMIKGAGAPDSNGLLPPEVLGGSLVANARLVDTDPHYRFGFRLLPSEPSLETGPPGAVYSQAQWEPGLDMWLCIDVYPRSALALDLDPITIEVKVNIDDPDSPLAAELADFAKYGKPFSAPLGTADIQARLPGGMGGPMTGAALRLLEIDDGEERRARLVLGDEDHHVLAESVVLLKNASTGFDRRGFYTKGREESGAFELEMRGHLDDERLHINLTRLPLAGRLAAEIDNGVQTFRQTRRARTFMIAPPVGLIPEDAWLPLPTPKSDEPGEVDAEHALIADLIHALALIQTRVAFPIAVPELIEYPVQAAREVIGLARLIEGSVVALHDQPLWLCGEDVERPPEDRFAYRIEQQMTFRWDDQEADLGDVHVIGWNLAAEAGRREGHEDHDDFMVTPADGSKWLASFDIDAVQATAPGLPKGRQESEAPS